MGIKGPDLKFGIIVFIQIEAKISCESYCKIIIIASWRKFNATANLADSCSLMEINEVQNTLL